MIFFHKHAEKSLKFSISKFQTFPSINLSNNYLPIDLFKELNCGQLQRYATAKNAKNLNGLKACFSKLSLKTWPSKVTLYDAKNEVSNLNRLAHESRNRENAMALPSHQDLFPDEADHALSFPIVKSARMNQHGAETIRIEV